MTRVALISDLHGNVLALEAVLQDIRRTGVDQIVCLGDVATLGPQPEAVLGILQDLGCPCILGNHDEFLFDAALVERYTQAAIVVQSIDWCRARLNTQQLAFVRTFQTGLVLELSPHATLQLFHGSPQSHMQDLLATTPAHELEQHLGAERGSVMAGGHTHIQMLRQHRGTLLVNPGSVGMPFSEYVYGGPPTILPHAEYAIVHAQGHNVGVDFKRVQLERRALFRAVKDCDNPLSASLREQYA